MENIQSLAASITTKLFESLAKKNLAPDQVSREAILGNIEQHLRKAENWSRRIQFAGMSTAELTDSNTLPLTLDSMPRRFSGSTVKGRRLSEEDILASDSNFLILGAPGSGKTTTLKRLARLVLLKPPASGLDRCQYPIVIRLREVSPPLLSIHQLIADELGIRYHTKRQESFSRKDYLHALESIRRERIEGSFVAVADKIESSQPIGSFRSDGESWDDLAARKRATKIVDEAFVGKKRLDQVLPTLLDETSAIVLLDGLDEVPGRDRLKIKEDIASLAMSLSRGRLVVTARSGDASFLEGFDVVEICPLEEEKISWIAHNWLKEPATFLAKLQAAPFRDLANRPLFLTHLIVFFRTKGYLPDQASDIYQRIITLILEEWDAQRGIRRGTEYAGFSPEKKLDFLAFAAFHLTYKLNLKMFRARDLVEVYEKGYEVFNLPRNQAREVAAEIETHTGLIAEATDAAYEFSHLSLQEYLCAYYLVRSPLSPEVHTYIVEYSQPIAVAVSLSSDPSRWLGDLILKTPGFFKLSAEPVRGFIARMSLEEPRFGKSLLLGFALLKLIFAFEKEIADPLVGLLHAGKKTGYSVAHSLADALRFFSVNFFTSKDDQWWIDKYIGPPKMEDHLLPDSGYVPLVVLKYLEQSVSLTFEVQEKERRGLFI